MTKYGPSLIEPKWQKIWEEWGIYEPDLQKAKKPFGKAQGKPFYNLMMFPYPSAEGLHVGNMYAFTGADIYGRYTRMKGFDVFEPIGLDGFGIHSENYALKVGKNPAKLAKETEKNFYRQLHATGNGYAWKEKLETYDPNYYQWTQWIFVQMFKRGLAYRAKAKVNWCPQCLTVLSDEQVITGACERCKTVVEKKEMEQWFFKITQYAERLLANLEKIDWSGRVKIAQRNWIGKSEGVIIKFIIDNPQFTIDVFTTRPDTLFGATFMVLSPEHPLLEKLQEINEESNRELYRALDDYIKNSKKKSDTERIAEGREKSGLFTGFYCLNPASGEKIPIWVADYVLMAYGTGAIMGVPAHDRRDFDFAQKYNLPIREVISPLRGAYEGEGVLVNSGPWNGWEMPEDIEKVLAWLEKKEMGQRKISYRLRDWCISRQRYWGSPIPMIGCPKCGWQPVPERDLPVLLPEVEDWRPKGTGKSPLASIESFVKTTCPKCGGVAQRETDVSDTFLDSAWYFFRYPSVGDGSCRSRHPSLPWDSEITKKWLPVNMYIGGAEHAVLHLLYTRFLTMVFHDWGLIDFEEPFRRFYAHGLLISEGAKMSKSKGNVVIPDAYISRYGADTLRCYLMFLGPFDQGGDFRDAGILGSWRFLNRVWKLAGEIESARLPDGQEKLKIKNGNEKSKNLEKIKHQTIKKVTEDMEGLRYNTALAALMEYLNQITNYKLRITNYELEENIKALLLLLAPFAPHLTEELWSYLNHKPYALNPKFSLHTQPWPKYDEYLTEEERVTLVVCVNGKIREKLDLSSLQAQNQKEVETLARQSATVEKYLTEKEIKKTVFVPGKLINFVI